MIKIQNTCIHLQISFKARTFKMVVANLWIVRQVHPLDILNQFLLQHIIFLETIKACTLFSVLSLSLLLLHPPPT